MCEEEASETKKHSCHATQENQVHGRQDVIGQAGNWAYNCNN